MKKRILICHWSMVIGGIEAALVNLLKRLDPDKYEVDLLLEQKTGEFLDRVPGYVNIIDAASIGLTVGSKSTFLRELGSFRLISACKIVYYRLRNDVRRYDPNYRKVSVGEYDVAVCYSHSLLLMRLLNDYVKAPLKMYFMHNEPFIDEKNRKDGPGFSNMADRGKYIGNFNYLFGVSDTITGKMKDLFPQYAERCRTVYNIIDVEEILGKSAGPAPEMADEPGVTKILSVGRFAPQKNFGIIPSVTELLVKRGLKVKWFVVGDGPEREHTQQFVREKHLEDSVFLLGARANPYPYFRACDIYCQPSLTEAYCTTICEARVFGKPIVATGFPGIMEQLSGGAGGKIVANDPSAIADAVTEIISMPAAEREEMLARSAYPNEAERGSLEAFMELLDQKEQNGQKTRT